MCLAVVTPIIGLGINNEDSITVVYCGEDFEAAKGCCRPGGNAR